MLHLIKRVSLTDFDYRKIPNIKHKVNKKILRQKDISKRCVYADEKKLCINIKVTHKTKENEPYIHII